MPENTLMLILIMCGPAALALTLFTGFRIAISLGKSRKEAARTHDLAARIEAGYEKLLARDEESRLRLEERFSQLEAELRERAERAEKTAITTRERLLQLETHLKEFFEVELKTVFESFDRTVASILEEMKAELLRGVDRIEGIQAVVDSKSFAQNRILDGEGSVYRMIAETPPPAGDETPPPDQQAAEAEIALEDDDNPETQPAP